MIDPSRAQPDLWSADGRGWPLIEQPNVSVMQERLPPGLFEVRQGDRVVVNE